MPGVNSQYPCHRSFESRGKELKSFLQFRSRWALSNGDDGETMFFAPGPRLAYAP